MHINRFIRTMLFAVAMLVVPIAVSAQVFVSVNIGPPALPVYEQPLCPAPGYIWVPGYWAFGPDGYFWVPGTWVLAPEPGLLWTPGYWGWDEGVFIWHEGYWGPTVGFYGGIPYGYGYTGVGYQGGYWRNNQFYYNRSVNNVNVTNVTNVYNTTVVNNNTVNRVSYNGGEGGITAGPTPAEEAAARERHVAPTQIQTQHVQVASSNRQLLASVNQGKPPIGATPKPAELSGGGVVTSKSAGAPYNPAISHAAPATRGNTPAAGSENNAARPGAEPRTAPAPRPEVPRPPGASRTESARPPESTRPEAAPRSEATPRPESAPREAAPRPENPPRPQPAPKESAPPPQPAPKEVAPHPQSAPRPQAAPKAQQQPNQQPNKERQPKKEPPSKDERLPPE